MKFHRDLIRFLARNVRLTAYAVGRVLEASWSGGGAVAGTSPSWPVPPDNRLVTDEATLDNAATMCQVGAWQLTLPAMAITWSRELRVILEVSPDHQPTLTSALAFYPPAERRRLDDALKDCSATGRPFALELQLNTAKHQTLLVRVMGVAVRDANGVSTHVQGALQDISATRPAELSQQLMASRLLNTLDTISDGVVTFDADCRFTYVNIQAERLLQRERGVLLGNRLLEVFPCGLDASLERHCRHALADRQPSHFEGFYEAVGLWLDVWVYPSEEGLAVYFRDVTQQRADHAELALLKTAVSRINDIVLITEAEPIDEPGPRIVFVNDAFERLTGYSRAEVIGQSPRILQGPDTSRVELDRVRAAMAAWKPVRAEVVNYTKSGAEFWIEMDISPIADANGWYTHWVSVERDVTDRRFTVNEILRLNSELEDRVTRRTAQLSAMNKELLAFSYSVSHDLRGPLTALEGFASLLAKREMANLSEKGAHYLNRIRAGARHMGELIDGLLALAKTANEPVTRVRVDLTALAQRMAQECLERNPDHQPQFHVQPGMTANADALLVSVVLTNLIGNACKFSAKTPAAVISVGSQPGDDGRAVYFVKDNGAGFDPAQADKLFGIFQRLHSADDYAGTGVGLTNVKRAVERHGGAVWAQGEQGVGATFYFTLV